MKREDDKRSSVIKSKSANVAVHSCIRSNSSERLESDIGEIVSFIRFERIDDWAGTMMEAFVRLVMLAIMCSWVPLSILKYMYNLL